MSTYNGSIRPRGALALLLAAGLTLAGCSANGGPGVGNTSSSSSGGNSSSGSSSSSGGSGSFSVTFTGPSGQPVVGVPFTISWTSSDPNAGCEATGGSASDGWAGTQEPASGSASIVEASPGSYTYSLICVDGGSTGNGSLAVTVVQSTGSSSSSGSSSGSGSGSSSSGSGSSSSGSGSSSSGSGSSSSGSGSSSSGSGSSSSGSGSSSSGSGSSSSGSGSSSSGSGSSSSGSGSSSSGSGSSSSGSGSSSSGSGSSSSGSGSSSSGSGSSSSGSGSSSSGSGSSSSGSGSSSSSGGGVTIKVVPPVTTSSQPISIVYTTNLTTSSSSSSGGGGSSGTTTVTSSRAVVRTQTSGTSATTPPAPGTTVCTASNTANDPNWTGTITSTGGTVASTAPAATGYYYYYLDCESTSTTGTITDSKSYATLLVNIPAPTPTDCGVTDNLGNAIPTKDIVDPYAMVNAASGGICVACSVTQPENITDQDPTNYAVINAPVGVIADEALTVTNTNTSVVPYAAGTLAGFVVSNPSELLTLNLLQSVTVTTLLDGQVQEPGSASQSNPLHLDLLTLLGNPQKSFVGFITSKPFDSIQISDGGVVSAVSQVNVYQACVSTGTVTTVGGSSSSGGGSSSSGSSSSSSSSSSGSSSGSSAAAAATTVSVSNPATPGKSFTLNYTVASVAGSTCTAYNTAGDPAWSQTVTGSGSLILTAPSTANVYSYGINCSSLLGGSSTSVAQLFDGIPTTVPVDCGVQDNFGATVPTQSMTDATASMSSGTGGLCLLCSVGQPQNVLDQDPINYAQMNTPVGLIDNVSLTATNNSAYTAGSNGQLVGFVVANPSELLTLDLLQSVSVTATYQGQTVATFSGSSASSALKLDLLTLLGNPTASFVGGTVPANAKYDALQITNSSLLSAIGQLDVYHACMATQ